MILDAIGNVFAWSLLGLVICVGLVITLLTIMATRE